MAVSEKLKIEFDFYVRHQDELVLLYNGKYLVIVGEQVMGAFETLEEAYLDAVKKFKPGQFMLHRCGPGTENYTCVINRAIL